MLSSCSCSVSGLFLLLFLFFFFYLVPDSHMSYFMMPTSVLGLSIPWVMLSQLVGTSSRVFKVCSVDAYWGPFGGYFIPRFV